MAADTMTAKSAQPRLRADALRNRERIVVAAREVIVESGAQTPSMKSLDGQGSGMPRSIGTSRTAVSSSTMWRFR